MKRKQIYFTSDWHLFHANIISFANRPFKDIEHMHRVLINNYNAVVPENGICYFLGDMGMTKFDLIKPIVERLNGTKALVLGNHDKGMNKMYELGFDIVVHGLVMEIAGEQVTFSHCPLRGIKREDTTGMKGSKPTDNWHRENDFKEFSIPNWGQFHCHGHGHAPNGGKSKVILDKQYDIGVDGNNYTPVSISGLESWITKYKNDQNRIDMKIIFKGIAGSHLFGLNTPQSDKDFKGVYLPSKKDILLGRIKRSVSQKTGNDHSKNTKDDVDIEYYSFDKFMRMLQEGQTVALEMLFTPEDKMLHRTPEWDRILAIRDKLVHKKVTSFIGYAKQQAAKYGIKGSRMAALKLAIDELNKHDPELRLSYKRGIIEKISEETEYCSFLMLPVNKNMQNKVVEHWEICGRKFDLTVKIGYVIDVLQKIYDGYGARAKLAEQNQCIDWKAISHALRVSYQGIELLETGKITLPFTGETKQFLLDVKAGKLSFNDVSPKLDILLNKLTVLEKQSLLQDSLNVDFVDDIIYNMYLDVINTKE